MAKRIERWLREDYIGRNDTGRNFTNYFLDKEDTILYDLKEACIIRELSKECLESAVFEWYTGTGVVVINVSAYNLKTIGKIWERKINYSRLVVLEIMPHEMPLPKELVDLLKEKRFSRD